METEDKSGSLYPKRKIDSVRLKILEVRSTVAFMMLVSRALCSISDFGSLSGMEAAGGGKEYR